jgi:hypothetical protein
MAKFYVGQRVRILYSNGWPELAGQEGRIVSAATSRGIEGKSEWQVAPDAWGTDIAPRRSPNGGRSFGPHSSQLEPILPDGHRACDDDFKRDLDKLLERQRVVA